MGEERIARVGVGVGVGEWMKGWESDGSGWGGLRYTFESVRRMLDIKGKDDVRSYLGPQLRTEKTSGQ